MEAIEEAGRLLDELSDNIYSDDEEEQAIPEINEGSNIGPISNAEFLRQNHVSFVISEKGKSKAEYKGFLFDFEKFSKPERDKKYWSCDKHKTKDGGCKARLHTLVEGNKFVKLLAHPGNESGHNHQVDPTAVAVAQIKSNMKRKAAETQDQPIQIFTQELQSASTMVAANLSKSAARKQIRRKRVKNQLPVVQANAVEDIYIPDEHKFYDGHELFLLADSGEHMMDPDRIMIFGRATSLVWCAEIQVVYFDGSFKITPPPFNQVYVMLAEKSAVNQAGGKYVFPILYALLKNKNRGTYDKLFGMIRALMPHLSPSSINVDFEQAAIYSLREKFPDSDINGCFFHLLKNFKKQLAEAGLMGRYGDPAENFALTARMLMSLAFVPPLNVYESFRDLQDYLMSHEPSLEPVIEWFARNYVGSVMRPPPFPIDLWSCYERTLAGEDRTNNFAEATHRRLQTILGIDHPTIGRFIGEMKKAQKLSDYTYEQCIRGQPAPKKRRVYSEADKRILALVELLIKETCWSISVVWPTTSLEISSTLKCYIVLLLFVIVVLVDSQ